MSWKTLTTFVTDLGQDRGTLDAAVQMTRRFGGHLDVVCLGVDQTQPEVYYTGAHALALPGAMEEASRSAETLETAVRGVLDGSEVSWTVTAVATPIIGITATVADAARFCDVVVAGLPYGKGLGQTPVQVVEAALFGAGAPVLVVPDRPLPARFDRIALAWNDSPEALRAARTALPLIGNASETELVIVDPPRHGPDRSDPGGRVAQMLARHGARVSIRILARSLPTVAATIARQVADSGADLLVMGAYGHSRLRESILGGATRDMLEKAEVPVLMAR